MGVRLDVDLTGRTFGKWKVLSRDKPVRNGNQGWLCRCECGREKVLPQSNLLLTLTTMCTLCAREPLPYPRGEVPYPYWREIYLGALGRGLGLSVSSKEAFAQLEKQGFKCALSGVPIQLPKSSADVQTASLDRIDSEGGYYPNNLQWVHRDVNYMKNVFPTDHFINFCRLVAANNPEVSFVSREELAGKLPPLQPKGRKKLTSKQVQEEWRKTGLWRGQKGKHVRRKVSGL